MIDVYYVFAFLATTLSTCSGYLWGDHFVGTRGIFARVQQMSVSVTRCTDRHMDCRFGVGSSQGGFSTSLQAYYTRSTRASVDSALYCVSPSDINGNGSNSVEQEYAESEEYWAIAPGIDPCLEGECDDLCK